MRSGRLFVVHLVMSLLPPTRFWALKRQMLRWAGATIGRGVHIVSSVRIHLTGPLSLGDNTFIGHEVMLVGGDAAISIGSNVDIAPRVLLATGSHQVGVQHGRAAGPGFSSPIHIGDGTWIGAGATILGGTRVGGLCIIAAGALVRTDTGDRALVAGVPARAVRAL